MSKTQVENELRAKLRLNSIYTNEPEKNSKGETLIKVGINPQGAHIGQGHWAKFNLCGWRPIGLIQAHMGQVPLG